MTGPPAPSPARRVLFFLFPFLVFSALLGAVEGLTRQLLPPVSGLTLLVAAPRQQAALTDRRQRVIFEADPLLFWRLQPGLREALWDGTVVTTNRQGLRRATDVGPKPPGGLRILCLGDSVTFGYRVPRVFSSAQEAAPSALPYPALLEQRLRAANPGRAIEVLPLAVPGYSSHQGLAWLRRDIGRLSPDLVVACFGWNDVDHRSRPDRQALPVDPLHVAARGLLLRSQALMHLSAWVHGSGAASGVPLADRAGFRAPAAGAGAPPAPADALPPEALRAGVARSSREEYVENLRAMVATARAHGARALVIGPVYRDREHYPEEAGQIGAYRDALRTALAGDGTPYLEVPALTEAGWPDNARLFEEHIHPNHRGHRLLAEALLQALARHALLPGVVLPAPEGTP